MEQLQEGRVLVVGARTTNVPSEMRANPRFVFWDSTAPGVVRKEVPLDVGTVVMTRFIGHALSGRLLKEARKRGLKVVMGEGTGKLREMFAAESEERMSTMVTMTEFVKTNGDVNKPPSEETRRLLKELEEKGVKSTEGSIMATLIKMRREAGVPRRERRKASPPAYITHLPPTTKHPSAKGTKSPTPTLDGAFTILQEGIAALQLALEGFREMAEENAQLRERVARIKELWEGGKI